MKSILITAMLFAVLSVAAQHEEPVSIPGTKCSMVPPEGFEAAGSFAGFQHLASRASIMVSELPAPFAKVAEGFTAENLKTRGVTLLKKETIQHNGKPAVLLFGTQIGNGLFYYKHLLVFGDDNKTVLVNANFPEAVKDMSDKIKAAVLSTSYDENSKPDYLSAAPFTIDVTGTDFVFVHFLSGMLMYSSDGKVVTNGASFAVGNALANMKTAGIKEYTEERLKKLPGLQQATIQSQQQVTINGLKGHEIVATAMRNNEKETSWLTMLYPETGGYFIMIGQTKKDVDNFLVQFRKIAATFNVK